MSPQPRRGRGGEQRLEPVLLLLGEGICTGAQGPPRAVERIVFAAPVPVEILLNTAPTLIRSITSEANDVEGVHHRDRVRESFGGSGLEAGEPTQRDHLHLVAPRPGPFSRPGLERLLGTALDHVQRSRRAGAVADHAEADGSP